MPIAAPSEPVYYYEVSAGDFRLVYFIPPEELRRLHDEELISTEVLADFPDGVDLDCTVADFDQFAAAYGYRPDRDPEALGHTFFAIFSTAGFEKERRSGFIAAADLEGRIDAVEATLHDHAAGPIDAGPDAAVAATPEPQMLTGARRQAKIRETLKTMPVDGIDAAKSLGAQQFSEISWSDGDPAEDAVGCVMTEYTDRLVMDH